MRTTTERAVTMPGTGEIHVVRIDGRTVGTLTRYNRKSAWSAHLGIGMEAKPLGTPTYSRTEALQRIVRAACETGGGLGGPGGVFPSLARD